MVLLKTNRSSPMRQYGATSEDHQAQPRVSQSF